MSWTDDRIRRAVDLYTKGHTAAHIANELGGVSRNAVIGKLHRLGVTRKGVGTPSVKAMPRKAKSAPKTVKPRPQAQRRAPKKVIKLESPIEVIKRTSYRQDGPVDLMQLSDRKCRYPLEHDGPRHLFCGGQPMEGSSYCEQHHAITHEKKKKSDGRRGGLFRFDAPRKAA